MMDTVRIGARIPEELYWRIKKLARNEAILRDNDTSMADLIREALEEMYPVEKENSDELRKNS